MFKIYCTNKKCRKETEALLNKENNEVECLDCGENINLPSQTKISMETIGQIKRTKKSDKAFSVECKSCKKVSVPILDKDKNIVCSHCNKILENISIPFANLIREKLKNK